MEQEIVLELFDHYADMVYRIALSYLRSPQEAEDVVQTVFLKLLEGGMIVYPGKERAFLTKVTINHCKNLISAAKKHESISLDETVLLTQPEDWDVLRAVMELPEKYRVVVSLHYFEGYSFREISEFLHIGTSAVSMRLHRAKSILKKQLGRD
ncbi:MAG: RNA polymerase sigma factor [Oscillospiraceae bacterium]|nr:RNA polymerase sigma factor [Oscillospiraceae bacterium]